MRYGTNIAVSMKLLVKNNFLMILLDFFESNLQRCDIVFFATGIFSDNLRI